MNAPRHGFAAIDFGPVAGGDALDALRADLHQRLDAALDGFTEPLRSDARSQVATYRDNGGSFFRLFYVPIWSFLHWVPTAAQRPVDLAVVDAARTAHALALFLHLWDDHLCDGQIPLDPLRLQMRTAAWERYAQAGRALALHAGADRALFDAHANTYVTAVYAPPAADDLDGYCRRFVDQIAIWTFVPLTFGTIAAGAAGAAALRELVESFGIAWRLLDDVQDVRDDVLANTASAVRIALDAAGRGVWDTCHRRSVERGRIDDGAWDALAASIGAAHAVETLLARIARELLHAQDLARARGWDGIAAELAQCLGPILLQLAHRL